MRFENLESMAAHRKLVGIVRLVSEEVGFESLIKGGAAQVVTKSTLSMRCRRVFLDQNAYRFAYEGQGCGYNFAFFEELA